MNAPEYRQLVQHIRGIASDLTQLLSPYKPQPSPSSSPIPGLQLVVPDDFFSFLPQHVVELKKKPLMECLKRSQQTFVDSYTRTAVQLQQTGSPTLSGSLGQLKLTYEQMYREQHLPALKASLERKLCVQSSPHPTKRKPFNAEYTPLLEKYFEYNAYPSPRDKEMLARKTMMDVRQIDVWFQNHRRRGRKDGKPLRRLSSHPLPANLSFDSLQQTMPSLLIPRPLRDEDSEKLTFSPDKPLSPPTPRVVTTELHASAPPHAFPAKYPPVVDYEPFPCKSSNSEIPAPIWPRKASTYHPPKSNGSVNELTTAFQSQLHFRSATRKGSDGHGSASRTPWYASTTTRLPSGCHPSLVRGLHPSTAHERPHVALDPQCSHASVSPQKRRKECGIPRRWPHSPSRPSHDAVRSRPKPYSRSSSLSSVSSASSASTSRSTSSNLSTPSSSPSFMRFKDLPPYENPYRTPSPGFPLTLLNKSPLFTGASELQSPTRIQIR